MSAPPCRWCDGATDIVLDLGQQPAADHFPLPTDPLPDPVHPLRMMLCRRCSLAQLADDATVPEEPRGVEPQALRDLATDAVTRLVQGSVLHAGDRVVEFGSPHGGSWEAAVRAAGMDWCAAGEQSRTADVVVDVFGLMHEPDQRAALTSRIAAVSDGGVLIVVFHSLATILREGQWNALRHGHFAYYSSPVLLTMFESARWAAVGVEEFELYGGTIMLIFRRQGDGGPIPAVNAAEMTVRERSAGVLDPEMLQLLAAAAASHMAGIRSHFERKAATGQPVLGYGAASRAVALLAGAGVGPDLLPAIVDAASAKQGRALPGTRIHVVSPEALNAAKAVEVVLFVSDLLPEVKTAYPQVESRGGYWVLADELLNRD